MSAGFIDRTVEAFNGQLPSNDSAGQPGADDTNMLHSRDPEWYLDCF
jgi:hypothetical protein